MDRFTLSLRETLTRLRTRVLRLGFAAALGCLLAFGQPISATSASEQGELFLRFKSAFEAGDWASAEERATALVRLIESNGNDRSRELVNPLTNLGTVAYRQGKFDVAIEHYQRAIQLIDGERAGARLLFDGTAIAGVGHAAAAAAAAAATTTTAAAAAAAPPPPPPLLLFQVPPSFLIQICKTENQFCN